MSRYDSHHTLIFLRVSDTLGHKNSLDITFSSYIQAIYKFVSLVHFRYRVSDSKDDDKNLKK